MKILFKSKSGDSNTHFIENNTTTASDFQFQTHEEEHQQQPEHELEDDDGFGVMSDHVIAQISHEKEATPDRYQVSKLSRLNASNDNANGGEGTAFKKRKVGKAQARRAATTKDDL
jgi:hypothetical protein